MTPTGTTEQPLRERLREKHYHDDWEDLFDEVERLSTQLAESKETITKLRADKVSLCKEAEELGEQLAEKDKLILELGDGHTVLLARINLLTSQLQAIRKQTVEECSKCVPTNWCDNLLTGKDAPKGPLGNRDVERLLRGVQDRIRALSDPTAEGESR